MADKYGDDLYTGCVKWFSKGGWGFITITASDDDSSTEDIFVHWDAITSSGYKYLVQGEYVQFNVEYKEDAPDGKKYQASNVCGVNGGKLMCDTRREQRSAAFLHRKEMNSNTETTKPPHNNRRKPVVRPNVPGHQWVLVPSAPAPRRRYNKSH